MQVSKARDTIAALATPLGRGGVGVIRISGHNLLPWASALTRKSAITGIAGKPLTPRVANYVSFTDADGRVIDSGLLLYFPAPHSFTGEDVLELQGHGGRIVCGMLLARVLALGARLADPGEFTRRAFLNGKLDLAQAESVADLIDAASESAARSAMRSLQGEFSTEIHGFIEALIELRALTEASLDFPDEELDFLNSANAFSRLEAIKSRLSAVFCRAKQGARLQQGLHMVIAGQPNVGKSSLLNRLAGHELAIVTPIAGTTRDAVRAELELAGIPIHIIDTAGLRDTDDEVERLGIAKTWDEISRADAILFVIDAKKGLTAEDHAMLARLPDAPARLMIENKADLLEAEISPPLDDGTSIRLSAKTGMGMERLRAALLEIAGGAPSEDVFIARIRHVKALERAGAHLSVATEALPALELFAEELRLAQNALTEITGEYSADDLLGEIFGRFCIGK